MTENGKSKVIYRIERVERTIYEVTLDKPVEKHEHLYGKLMHPTSHVIESETITRIL